MNFRLKIWPSLLFLFECRGFTSFSVDRKSIHGNVRLSRTAADARVLDDYQYNGRKGQVLRIWAVPVENDGDTQNITSLATSDEDSILQQHIDSSIADSAANQALRQKYRTGGILYAAIALILFACPDRTLTKRLASKWGGAAGFGLAAGVSYLLAGASQRKHLNKDTYKRLNVGLMGFAVLGSFAVPGEAGFFHTMRPAIILSGLCNAARIYGASVAYVGWSRGIFGNGDLVRPKAMFQELFRGSKATLRGFKVIKQKKSLAYRNCLLLVLFGLLSSFMEGVFNLRYRVALKKTLFDSSLQWSAVSRLFLISTMIYSLKDAAESDRLTGSSFIQMNIMIGAWALLVGVGQGMNSVGFSGHRVEMLAFSLPFFIKGLKGQKERSDKQKLVIPPLDGP